MDTEKIRNIFTLIKIYYDRGGSLTTIGKNIVMFAIAFKIYDMELITSIILAIMICLGFIVIGYIDHKWGIFSNEQGKMSGEINPHLKQVSDDTAEIKRIIKEWRHLENQ